jgi:hypothetical protein
MVSTRSLHGIVITKLPGMQEVDGVKDTILGSVWRAGNESRAPLDKEHYRVESEEEYIKRRGSPHNSAWECSRHIPVEENK